MRALRLTLYLLAALAPIPALVAFDGTAEWLALAGTLVLFVAVAVPLAELPSLRR